MERRDGEGQEEEEEEGGPQQGRKDSTCPDSGSSETRGAQAGAGDRQHQWAPPPTGGPDSSTTVGQRGSQGGAYLGQQ